MFKRLAVAGLLLALLPLHAEALENEDLLALVAMPLAVAAVSELAEVPAGDLVDVVTLLNDAAVAPAEFVEVVRYVPVAFAAQNDQPDFVEFVRRREEEGLRGTQLVVSIEERIRFLGAPNAQLVVAAARVSEVDETFLVPVRKKLHPHGGPPGQLKKAAGVKTGAEIVHGRSRPRVAARADDDDRGRGRGKGKGEGKGHGKGKGKG